MSVRINIPQFLRHLASDAHVADVNGETVGECLNDLVKRFPSTKRWLFDDNGKLLNAVEVYVNGESTYPEELNKPVNDRDELHILLIIAGG